MRKKLPDKIKPAIDILTRQTDSKLVTHLNACVHCGLCQTSCLFWLAGENPAFIPARKVDLVASIYRRYCTLVGRVAPQLVNAKELDDKMMTDMVDALYGACTLCGRCVKHCSIGVDIPFVVKTGRRMLAAMGCVPATLQATVDAALNTGNNMGIATEEFVDTIQWMEEELQEETGDGEARIPLDQTGKEILYTLNPREPKFFPLSITAAAKIFHAAQADWTISSKMYDVTNYGYFSGNDHHAKQIAQRMFDEVGRLDAKTLVLGECGHGSRALRWEAPNYMQQHPSFEIITLVELIEQYIKSGKIKLDKQRNAKTYTIHDPCNLTRNGGLFQSLRFVVKSAVPELIEMNPFGNDNFCCGGGGMLAMSEYNERRIAAGKIKADQIKATGAQVVITPCHNCVDQLSQINHTYHLGIEVKSVAEVVADALEAS